MLEKKIELINEITRHILEKSPGSVVRYRLLRDVLGLPVNDTELQEARESLGKSQCVKTLAAEQWEDGSWGAFHSQNTKVKQKIPTTEIGVERALALGLDGEVPLLCKAADYILSIMNGHRPFPDRHEKNDRWQTGMRMFLASTLSLIYPNHPELEPDRNLWWEIAEEAFQSGTYREMDEVQVHKRLTGVTVKNSYLVLNNRYQLNILGSIPGTLPRQLEKSLLKWLWSREDGIGYLGVSLHSAPLQKPGTVDRWLASLELLSRGFHRWVDAMDWLWSLRKEDGFGDFGPRPSSITNLPLSDTWRNKQNRVSDWSTRVLILMRRFYQASDKYTGNQKQQPMHNEIVIE